MKRNKSGIFAIFTAILLVSIAFVPAVTAQAESQNKELIKENNDLKVKLSHLTSQLDDILTLRDEIKLLNNTVQTQITLTDSTLKTKIDEYNRTLLQLKHDFTSKGERNEISKNS